MGVVLRVRRRAAFLTTYGRTMPTNPIDPTARPAGRSVDAPRCARGGERHDLDLTVLSDVRKTTLLSGRDEWHLESIPEFGLPAITMSDGPHGLRKVEDSALLRINGSVAATCFPTGSALGASWDPDLLHEIGVAIAGEAIANGVDVVLGPGVNIKRNPLCGRNFEYFSEDPLLSGALAAAYINGIQSQGVGASLKHFAVNSQESHRFVVDAIVDEQTIREIYLTAFEIAVKTAQPWTVMGAYNRLNGISCTENTWLLTSVLRDDWGFEGLLITDWGATNDRVAAIGAGMDLEMPGGASAYDRDVLEALRSGKLDHGALDRCVVRLSQLVEKTQRRQPASTPYDPGAHHRLARRAAAACTVLLKNTAAALPIEPGKNIAIIGAFAVQPRFQGGGSSQVNARVIDDALDCLRSIATEGGGQVDYAAGYDERSDPRKDLIDEAVTIARNADVAIVFVGLPVTFETEGVDRDHLELPEQHNRLVEAVSAVNRRTVVVLMNGAPVVIPWVERPAAIVESYLGGEAVGAAIADVLYGLSEPGGRLAETFPLRHADSASSQWFPGEPRQVEYREGLYVGYRWFDTAGVDVLFPFGHGLSYTTFEISDVTASPSAINAGESVTVSAHVTNTGSLSGSEVIQIYVAAADSAAARPTQELRAFKKVRCEPGESVTVALDLGPRAFAHWDTDTHAWQISDGPYEVHVATSSRRIHASRTVCVISDFAATPPADDSPYSSPRPHGWTVDDAAFEARLGRPIPTPTPTRPFHRNSTLGEIGQTRVGRPLLALVRKGAEFAARRSNEPGGVGVTANRALHELPIRSLAAMSRGFVSLKTVDRFLALTNWLDRPQKPETAANRCSRPPRDPPL